MPAPEPEPLTPAAFDAALARAGIAATPPERERALEAARRLRRLAALLRTWNADDPA
jgi:hypothetical protein